MTEHVHLIPVGFDFERLILPISKEEMDADRVVLITHEEGTGDESEERAAELATNMRQNLERSFDLIDIQTEMYEIDVDELYEYEVLYTEAYSLILNELEQENQVYINISSMPRTVSFAFATAADSIITEFQNQDEPIEEDESIRDYLHTYYVAPDDYLVLDMIDILEDVQDLLEEFGENVHVYPELNRVQDILERVEENGVTEGAKDLGGEMYVEFPSSPGSNVEGFETTILHFLYANGPIKSTSKLAEQLADELGVEYDDSFRSRVQYNATKLDEKGYVSRVQAGNRLETDLSTMGRMWVTTR